MRIFDKGFTYKALGSISVNYGNTWGPINIHIKFKQLVPSRRLYRSGTTGSISTMRQVHRTLYIRRNRIVSSNSSIRGIQGGLGCVCIFAVCLHKIGHRAGKLF